MRPAGIKEHTALFYRERRRLWKDWSSNLRRFRGLRMVPGKMCSGWPSFACTDIYHLFVGPAWSQAVYATPNSCHCGGFQSNSSCPTEGGHQWSAYTLTYLLFSPQAQQGHRSAARPPFSELLPLLLLLSTSEGISERQEGRESLCMSRATHCRKPWCGGA